MRCFICGVVTSAQRGPLTSDRATQEKCICASPRQRVWDVKTWCSAGRPTARETLGNVSKRIDRSPKPQVARSSRAGSASKNGHEQGRYKQQPLAASATRCP